ncbi:hypothetical protein Xaut_4459 [Xanthobacter versatilis]|uniref:DUF3253 domain-containing protein n=2 Tax=Xanthobacter autotrophicus (strain ATCC BAA-1158 / Py2) TaxID=78245 RepID=A7INT4_XANP2|nr:hypothetical protein Xaut_4459 [Xanthobacter autotrophicus Py2]
MRFDGRCRPKCSMKAAMSTDSRRDAAAPTTLPDDLSTEAALLRLTAACGPGKSISPMDAAQALMTEAEWQRALPVVRRVAVRMAQEGRLLIYRKGKPIDPAELRGVYRIGAPRDE